MKKRILALLLVSAAPSSVFAQTGAPDTSPSRRQNAPTAAVQTSDTTSDIIITATRRPEKLSDVPISVNVISGAALQRTGATDIRLLNQVSPSLFVSSASSEGAGTARIRGIGTSGENLGLESAVALFVDGVYRSRTGGGLGELVNRR